MFATDPDICHLVLVALQRLWADDAKEIMCSIDLYNMDVIQLRRVNRAMHRALLVEGDASALDTIASRGHGVSRSWPHVNCPLLLPCLVITASLEAVGPQELANLATLLHAARIVRLVCCSLPTIDAVLFSGLARVVFIDIVRMPDNNFRLPCRPVRQGTPITCRNLKKLCIGNYIYVHPEDDFAAYAHLRYISCHLTKGDYDFNPLCNVGRLDVHLNADANFDFGTCHIKSLMITSHYGAHVKIKGNFDQLHYFGLFTLFKNNVESYVTDIIAPLRSPVLRTLALKWPSEYILPPVLPSCKQIDFKNITIDKMPSLPNLVSTTTENVRIRPPQE